LGIVSYVAKYISSSKVFQHPDKLSLWLDGRNREISPITIELHISNICNQHCNYCFSVEIQDKHIMSVDDATKAIDKIALLGTKGIIFSGGGEPTIHKSFNKLIEYSYRRGMDVGVITNCMAIDSTISETILKYCSWIRISIDTIDKETYAKTRGVDGVGKVINNIKRLLSLRIKFGSATTIGVQTVLTPENISSIEETCREFDRLLVDYHQIRPLENVKYDPNLYTDIISILGNLKKKYKRIIISTKWDTVNTTDITKKPFSSCHAYPLIGAVSAYGYIYICCHMIGIDKFCYGNVLTDSVDELLSNREIASKNINVAKCPIACRGSEINRTLEGLIQDDIHSSFL
jgi:GTP 3',8-cyclase